MIDHNNINAAGGNFTQTFLIHNQKGISDGHDPIVITNNNVRNGHPVGVKVCNQTNVTIENNFLNHINVKGIDYLPEYAPTVIRPNDSGCSKE